MNDLKRHVESIVAPIPAEEIHKNKYRQELYAHLLQLYHSERHAGDDGDRAVETAIDRLGDPRTLRAEFLAALRPWDRWFGYIDYWSSPRRGEAAGRYALRMTWSVAAVFFALVNLILIPAFSVDRSTSGEIVAATYSLAVLVGWSLIVFAAVLAYVHKHVESVRQATGSRRRRHARLLRGAIVAGAVFWSANAAAWYLLRSALLIAFDGSHAANVVMTDIGDDFGLLYWSTLSALVFVMPWAIAWDVGRRGDIPDWPYAQ